MIRLRTVEVYRDARRSLFVIESVGSGHGKSGTGCHLYGYLVPLAIIVCSADGNRVMAVDTDDADLETLRQRHPELDELIARTCTSR